MSLGLAIGGAWALVAAAPLLTRVLGRRAGWLLAACLLGLTALVVSARSTGDVQAEYAWMPTIGVSLRLRLDGLSFLFALVVLVVGALVLVYSSSYVRTRTSGFFTLMTGFVAAMLLLVLADDLVVLFVAWELTTLCSYLLVLRSGSRAGAPATRVLLVTAAGGLSLLGAVAVMVVRTGTTHLTAVLEHPAWQQDPTFAGTVAVLVAFAAMTKSAQMPFHSWLPDAMVAPAPVSAYLHAAAMVKAGIFLLMLLAPGASASALWTPLLLTVGLTTSVVGGLFALQRTDLKELLAYSTVSQLGLLVAVIGVGTSGAMLAASVHVVAHALFKSAAFMSVGLIETRTGSRDIRELRGLWRAMPGDSLMLVLTAASMAALPPLLGFVSKELVLDAMLHSPAGAVTGWVTALVVTAGAVLTVAYSLRMLVTTLPGPAAQVTPWRTTVPMSLAIGTAAVGGLVLGLAVPLLDAVAAPAAAVAAGVPVADVYPLALWHGLNAALALSAVAILGGVGLTVARHRVDRVLVGRALLPFTGAQVVQRCYEGAIALGRRVGDVTRSDQPAAHLALPLAGVGAAGVLVAMLWQGVPAGSTQPLDVALLAALALGVVIVARAGSRLTSVIAVGVVGFAVVLWFLVLGASDVALTQLLVEILTVVVMVLVLRRMPPRFAPEPRRRHVGSLVISVAAGVAATLATLTFTGHRGLSQVGEFFLREAKTLTGGTNVVNTILVDFRALDTLGELVVLAIGALAVTALLDARPAAPRADVALLDSPVADPHRNALFLQVLDRALVPVMLAASLYALLRGHNAPGGGFIAALVGAAALVLAYLAAPTDAVSRLERPFLSIAGAGVVVAVGTGLLGLLDGSFLRPLHVDVLGLHLTSALLFDVGVYLAVLGVVLAAIHRLGLSPSDDARREADADADWRAVEDEEVGAR
ncbi:hydrogen gas-evolving membrane-bound hydrogenase subunit E [Cellulomonas phragmiteti]|uniref:Monovalent cation/H+ antiporter subunit A n=1 Tax=Cellulomonas phragmiteti TaxID=478780 RepID=A0ABQ4DRG6_9CELL|nr:hydrogen gas-evolving membrane-bound hydrogenase subunit E [Cellulomonas phragmiteti]GIG41572.1 monovalent cation/H+ antiporter subunit A [Cellulomonas phragmiteti]